MVATKTDPAILKPLLLNAIQTNPTLNPLQLTNLLDQPIKDLYIASDALVKDGSIIRAQFPEYFVISRDLGLAGIIKLSFSRLHSLWMADGVAHRIYV